MCENQIVLLLGAYRWLNPFGDHLFLYLIWTIFIGTIRRAGPDSMQLPTSHTCFNTLLLPDYSDYDKLVDRLGRAVIECEGFGLQ
jgi:HECT-domain (ubiquitin-transferase)